MASAMRMAALVAAASLVAACGPSTSGTPSVPATTGASAVTVSATGAGPSSSSVASQPVPPTASPQATSAPTASVGSSDGWTIPVLVDPDADCTAPVAAVDGTSHDHVAALCGGSVHYASSGAAGWSSVTVFDHPGGVMVGNPQIAVDGTKVYVVYSQTTPLEGCGNGADQGVGVYVRTRVLPDGAWSAAARLGPAGDQVESFRVVNGTVYAVVLGGGNEGTVLEVSGPTGLHRYPVNGQNASLRVGSDGRPRLAYESYGDGRIGLATLTGSALSASLIPDPPGGIAESSNIDPHLILDAHNHAQVIWTITPLGCALPAGSLQDGTWYATNASGSWQLSRLTIETGETSLTADVKNGVLYALVGGSDGLGFFSTEINGNWTRTTLLPGQPDTPSIHFDAATGSLLVVFAGSPTAAAPGGIYVMTLPPQPQ